MDTKEARKKAEETINDLTTKVDGLKSKMTGEDKKKTDLNELIEKMDSIKENIQNKLKNAEDSGEANWDEFNKNIYRDLESFNDAFRKAGKIFAPEKGLEGQK
jgi:DNA repair exonuclease SbcCD ATPase subunit